MTSISWIFIVRGGNETITCDKHPSAISGHPQISLPFLRILGTSLVKYSPRICANSSNFNSFDWIPGVSMTEWGLRRDSSVMFAVASVGLRSADARYSATKSFGVAISSNRIAKCRRITNCPMVKIEIRQSIRILTSDQMGRNMNISSGSCKLSSTMTIGMNCKDLMVLYSALLGGHNPQIRHLQAYPERAKV